MRKEIEFEMMPKEVIIYTYEIISSEWQGRRVKSFENIFFDEDLCIVPHPNMPICCFDDEHEYILSARTLKLVDRSVMNIPTDVLEGGVEDETN